MKGIFFLSALLSTNIYAQNLEQLRGLLQTTNKHKAIMQKSKADKLEVQQYGIYETPTLSTSVTHADATPSGAEDGLEYGVSFSQNLDNFFVASHKNRIVSEAVNVIEKQVEYQKNMLELDLISEYHSACMAKEMKQRSTELYKEQNERYLQIESAYDLGEISRKSLLFHKLELVKTQQNVSEFKREYIVALGELQSSIDNTKIIDLECNDILEPTNVQSLKSFDEHAQLKVLDYKRSSSEALSSIYTMPLSTLGYEFGFEKELDTDRYTVGINIPLSFLSDGQEKLKEQHYAMNSSYLHEKNSLSSEIKEYASLAKERLNLLHDEYQVLKERVLPLNKELLELSKLALLEGEGNFMEYLDASRSYRLNILEMLEIKQDYYSELFELYKVADAKYGERK